MKIRVNKDGSFDRYKATFYEDEVLTIAHCLNFVIGMVKENQEKGNGTFLKSGELEAIVDLANKCNDLVSQLPNEEEK